MTWLIKYTGYVSGCNEDGMRIKRGGAVKRRRRAVGVGLDRHLAAIFEDTR